MGWLVIILTTVLFSPGTSLPSDQFSSLFGPVSTLMKNGEASLFHMESDLYTNQGILFSDGCALKTVLPDSAKNVVGKSATSGYKEGNGENATFNSIKGFTQLNGSAVIAVDSKNHCLRIIDRDSRATASFSGTCTKAGYRDGIAVLYNNPQSVVLYDNRLYITDRDNSAIRVVYMNSRTVVTRTKGNQRLFHPSSLIVDPSGQFMYITIEHGIVRMEVNSGYVNVMTSKVAGYQDGQIRTSTFDGPHGMTWLTPTVLAVVDHLNNRVRLIDLEAQEVTSMCNGVQSEINAVWNDCSLNKPLSILFHKPNLYIGEFKAIRQSSLHSLSPIGK